MGRRKERAGDSAPASPLLTGWRWPLVFLLVAAGAAYIYQRTTVEHHSGKNQVIVVQREKLSGRSYREVAEQRMPLILTGTVANKWKAMSSFTTSFLAQRLPFVMAHRQEKKRNFVTFHDNKPLQPLVNEKWEDFNVKINATLPQVLGWDSEVKDPSTGPFLYFSQDITTLRSDFPDVMDHIQPLGDLILSPDDVQVNLWIGRAGIVTHTHYDCTFNFFVQLRGRKRFTLFPPDSQLYLYPCLHPHYGHSQVDIHAPNLSIFPEFSWTGSMVAVVGAGDMLVVPPFWFHHVETLEESVSVNVWSNAPEYTLINRIYEQPVPFEEEWTWELKGKAAKIYIEMLLQSLDVNNSFLSDLLHHRYGPVVLSGNFKVSEKALDMSEFLCNKVKWHEETLRLSPILERGVHLIQPLFALISTSGTMEICLGNYVEHLLHLAVGLDYVYPFLEKCF